MLPSNGRDVVDQKQNFMSSLIKPYVLILLLVNFTFVSPHEALAPEICDNGLDDDNDGLIDLNDDDCYCEPLEQPSLIPNPSFEEQDCCPPGPSRADCATHWLQASEGTPDYLHSCSPYGAGTFMIPQPMPDGEGFAGFIDGSLTGNISTVVKEYVGTCLPTSLKPDTLYRLEFYTGFMSRDRSPDIEIALFGTTDCANLPFGMGNRTFGCPANSPNWVLLGSVSISGENQWVKSQFKIRTNLEITAIAIGPGCALRSNANNSYHFIDQLILKENNNFDLGIKATGQACTNNLTFEIRPLEGYQYQWYKNGIAIPQATANSLQNPPGPGQYQVRLENNEGCKISTAYTYAPSSQVVQTSETICAGEDFNFNNRSLSAAGIYWDTLKTVHLCDSIVVLELLVSQAVETSISTKIFPGESFQIGDDAINRPGEHIRTLPSVSGCDSTVYLQLAYYAVYIPSAFSPNDDYINDIFAVYGDSDVKEISSLSVFDRWGGLVFEGKALKTSEGWDGTINGKAAPPGLYAYTLAVLTTDDKEQVLNGWVTLVR